MAVWIGATGNWLTGGNWDTGIAPNAIGAVADLPDITAAAGLHPIDLQGNTITLGTLNVTPSFDEGYDLRSNAAATPVSTLNMRVNSGSAAINVAPAGGLAGAAANLRIGQSVTLGLLSNTILTTTGAGSRVDIIGKITGAGLLTKRGIGALEIDETNNDWSGGLAVEAGKVVTTSANVLGSGAVSVTSGATLDVGGGHQAINTLTGAGTVINGTTGTVTLTQTNNAAAIFSGVMAVGAGSANIALTKAGTGKWTLTGANTYTGVTTISAGELSLGNGGTSGLIASASIVNNGKLTFDRSNALTYGGVIAGTGTVEKSGAGTLTLTGANTFNGVTTINGGTLNGGAASTFSGSSTVDVAAAAALDLGGFNQSIGGLSGAGLVTNTGAAAALTINQSGNTTFSGIISNGTSGIGLSKSGSGALTLTGANSYSGGTTINEGSIRIGAGGTTGVLGTGAISIAVGARLVYDKTNAFTISGLTSGAGGITANSGGILTLGNAGNTFSGGITLDFGAVRFSNASALGTGGILFTGGVISTQPNSLISNFNGVVANDVTFNAGAFGQFAASSASTTTYTGDFTLASGASLNFGANASFSGIISLALASVTGAASLGAGKISNGTLRAGNQNAATLIAGFSNLEISVGATFDVGGFSQAIRGLSGAGAVTNSGAATAILSINQAGASTFSGVMSDGAGALFLTKNGAGTLTLAGANTFTGAFNVNGGNLALADAGSVAQASAVSLAANVSLDISGISASSATIQNLDASNGGHTLTLGGKTLNLTNYLRSTITGTIAGSAGADGLNITFGASLPPFSLAGTTFTNWTDGADTISITGNTSANAITGSSRADIINGGAGNDTLNGGLGNDTLIGGSVGAGLTNQLNGDGGSDTASYEGTSVQVYADLNTNAGFLGVGVVLTDLFTSIENLIGGSAGDTLVGDSNSNRLTGNGGDDLLFGEGGSDTLIGGGHATGSFNQLFGGAGIDTVDYSAESGKVFVDLRAPAGHIDTGGGFILNDLMNSIERVLGGSNDDTILGTDADNNLLTGNAGTDLLFGLGGDDLLFGGAANAGQFNQLFGGAGNDTAAYSDSIAGVYADLNIFAGFVKNGAGTLVLTDTYNQVENLTGSLAADTLVGDNGANVLRGVFGADILYANFDANNPNQHDASIDTFVYQSAQESTLSAFDQIVNFTSGQDKIDLRSLGINAGLLTLNNNGNGTFSIFADTDGVAGIGIGDFAVLVQSGTFVMSDIRFV